MTTDEKLERLIEITSSLAESIGELKLSVSQGFVETREAISALTVGLTEMTEVARVQSQALTQLQVTAEMQSSTVDRLSNIVELLLSRDRSE